MGDTDGDRGATGSLSAILFADVKDFSRRMGESETAGIAAVAAVREVFDQVVPRHGGTFEVSGGDTFLALFGSATDATRAAIKIQLRLAEPGGHDGDPPTIRIGLHIGDVTMTANGLVGDSINTAARIQGIAEPGGISLSEEVYRAVRSKLTVRFHDGGPQALKNVRYAGHIYRIHPGEALGAMYVPAEMSRWSRRAVVGAGGAVLLGGGLLAWWRVGGFEERRSVTPPAETNRKPLPPEIATKPGPIVIGVMQIVPRGAVSETACGFTRDALNTVLSKLDALRVFSKQKIDFVREKRGLSEIEAAEALGIEKMVSGTLGTKDDHFTLEIQIVDVSSGLLEHAREIQGSEQRLVDLQNKAATAVVQGLRVAIASDDLSKILAARTADTVDAYQLLTDQMGGEDEAPRVQPRPAPKRKKPNARWWPALTATAWAGEDVDQAAVRALLDAYRAALETRDLKRLAEIHVDLNDKMRGALSRYFESVKALHIKFSDVDVLVEGDEALATFTRIDDFKDAATDRDMHFEVRVSSVLARDGAAWKIRGLKKPS